MTNLNIKLETKALGLKNDTVITVTKNVAAEYGIITDLIAVEELKLDGDMVNFTVLGELETTQETSVYTSGEHYSYGEYGFEPDGADMEDVSAELLVHFAISGNIPVSDINKDMIIIKDLTDLVVDIDSVDISVDSDAEGADEEIFSSFDEDSARKELQAATFATYRAR